MAETIVDQPSLINQPPATPPVPVAPETKLFPELKSAEPVKPDQPVSTTAPEPKPMESKPEAPKEEPKTEDPKPTPLEAKAPVDYETLKLPEGSLLSNDELAAVKREAKENNLSLEETQGILDMKNESVRDYVKRQNDAFAQAKQTWKTAWENDPDYGGDKFRESTELASRAWNRLADPELKTLADQTGWGNHPAVLRCFARIGKLISEDTLIRGSIGVTPKQKTPEERLYGSTTPAEEVMS